VREKSSTIHRETRVVHHAHERRPLRLRVHSVIKWLHVYISMFTMLLVLFFALTGITLNHPDWLLGGSESSTEVKGTLPAGWKQGSEVDWLKVVEYLRAHDGVHGVLADHRVDETEGSLTFKGPGYSADCFFDPTTGSYQMTIVQQGAVGVLNDLHRGRDAGIVWSRVVDISGVFLVTVALTGIGLLWYMKKMRRTGLTVMALGALVAIVLMKLTS
jgi:hypothetical protein